MPDNEEIWADGAPRPPDPDGRFAAVDAVLDGGDLVQRPPNQGRHFPVFPLADLKKPPPPEYLIKGVICHGDLAALYGPPGTGKSFLALDMALHIALGWPWRGRRVRRWPVVYLAAEGGAGMKRRAWAFKSENDVSAAESGSPFYLVTAAVALAGHDSDERRLIEEIKDIQADTDGRPPLLVIDTVSRNMAGEDENSPEGMGSFLRCIDNIVAETGVTVLLVHHTGKDPKAGLRGHTSLLAALDVAIELKRPAEARRIEVRLTKAKDFEDGLIGHFELKTVDLGLDDDGDAVTTCVVNHHDDDGEEAPPRARLSPQGRVAMRCLDAALAEHGAYPGAEAVAAESPALKQHSGSAVKVVRLAVWKDICGQRGLSNSDNPDSFNRTFRRHKTDLLSNGIIKEFDGWIWVAGQ